MGESSQKLKVYDFRRKRLGDVININWKKKLVIYSFGGQSWFASLQDVRILDKDITNEPEKQ